MINYGKDKKVLSQEEIPILKGICGFVQEFANNNGLQLNEDTTDFIQTILSEGAA